jgi:integrase/recombinase XerD
MPNEEVFSKYFIQLRTRVHNEHNYQSYVYLLETFKGFLGDKRPSADLAIEFVAGYYQYSLNTQAKYAAIIKGFMKYYGEPVDDLKIRRPHATPQVVEDDDIDKLLDAARNKKSHKKKIERDLLIFELYMKTGMRRAELADLKVRNVHKDFLMVIKGKGEKDRMIPLLPDLAKRLHKFVGNKGPEETVFGLKAASIGNKVYTFAKKAGINVHTHSFRHKYARDLLQKGANIRTVQELLGHSNLNTTQVYLAVTEDDRRKAVNLLANEPESENPREEKEREHLTDRRKEIGKIVEILSVKNIAVCNRELNAKDILYVLRVKLSQGIKHYGVLGAIVDHFGGSIQGEHSDDAFELFSTYNQLQLVDTQLRREGIHHPYDEPYWVLSDLGKQVIRYLSEIEYYPEK